MLTYYDKYKINTRIKCKKKKWKRVLFWRRGKKNMAITMEDIIESNRIKAEAWNDCKESLKDDLTVEQLEKLGHIFYTAAQGYIFKRKEY